MQLTAHRTVRALLVPASALFAITAATMSLTWDGGAGTSTTQQASADSLVWDTVPAPTTVQADSALLDTTASSVTMRTDSLIWD